jgi:hypothetical protein
MKKKIIGICLVLTLFLTLHPMSVAAAPSGRIEGVDYSRITSGSRYQVMLTLGNLNFPGTMERGTTLSDEELNKIIREVMTSWSRDDERLPQSGDQKGYLTSAVLKNQDLIATAEQMELDLPREMISTILGGIMDTASNYVPETGPAGDVVLTAYKNIYIKTIEAAITGKIPTSAEEIKKISSDDLIGFAADIAKNTSADLVDSQGIEAGVKYLLKKAGKATGWVKHAFAAKDLLMTGIDVYLKHDEMQELIDKGFDRASLLNDFYAECNKRIAEAGDETGEWLIRFDNAKTRFAFSMWGVYNLLSEWRLSGELARQGHYNDGSYGGEYTGDLTLEIEGLEMDVRFDKNYLDAMPLIQTALNNEEAARGIKYKDNTNTPTVLKRSVVWNLTVAVAGSGEFTAPINGGVNVKTDNITFNFDHTISGSAKKGMNEDFLEYTITSTNPESYMLTQKAWMVQTLPVVGSSKQELMNNGPNTVAVTIGSVWWPLEKTPQITIFIN